MTLTAEAATLMKDKLRTLTMQDFAGEDVHKAATVIRGTHKRLEMINDVPSDLPQWIINIFLTCSVPQFIQIFTGGVVYDVPTIIEVAESTYVKLSTVWTVTPNTTPSTFSGRNNRQLTRWGCGKVGHSLDKCPTTSDTEKARIFESKRKNKTSGGDSNINSSVNNNNGNSGGSRAPNPDSIRSQSKMPPKDGESHIKMMNGRERKWCAICKW